MKAACSFETSGIDYTVMRRHTAPKWNPQPDRRENLTTRIVF